MALTYQQCVDIQKAVGLPVSTKEEFEHARLMDKKFDEYKAHFGNLFGTEGLIMTDDEIIRGIDRCIKYNKEWDGFIVPILGDDDEI